LLGRPAQLLKEPGGRCAIPREQHHSRSPEEGRQPAAGAGGGRRGSIEASAEWGTRVPALPRAAGC